MTKSSILFTLLAAGAAVSAASTLRAATTSDDAFRSLANAPLRFEPSGSGYVTRGLSFSSSLHGDHMDLRTKDQAMRVTFAHASSDVRLQPGELLSSKSNVIHGNDRSKWRTVPNYRDLRAHDLYPGVDLVYYGNHGELEYDLIVKPGASPKAIRLQIDGANPTVGADGNLTAAFIQKRPVAYQIAADGSRSPVSSRYRKNSDGTFSFGLGRYDRRRELVIDPSLTFSLYISDLAGNGQNTCKAIGHDANGNIYVGGITLSTDFEIDPNINQIPGGPQGSSNSGGYDMFFVQIVPATPAGNNPVGFATYVGGSSDDILTDMHVGPTGLVYLTGYTTSTDFPSGTITGYQTSLSGTTDAVVVLYDPTQPVGQQLVYSSYLGGGTGAAANGITVDAQGRFYIVGTTNSSEVPVVNGLTAGLNGTGGISDAFVSGFDPSKSGYNSLFYSTFIGGSSNEEGYGITLAPDHTLWVVGETYSKDFPMTGNGYQGNNAGSADAFVVQIDPIAGGSLLYSSYFGGSGVDMARKVVIDAKGRVVVTGYTLSGDFPATGDALQSTNKGFSKGFGNTFITVLNPSATGNNSQLVYSTYYGGSGDESPSGMVTDASGAIYITGYSGSFDLPITANALETQRVGGEDGYVLKMNPSIAGPSGLLYSSYIASIGSQTSYGIDLDTTGNIYLTGYTSGGIFDALNGVAKTSVTGNIDGFLMGISLQ
jgi:hypothetical protein